VTKKNTLPVKVANKIRWEKGAGREDGGKKLQSGENLRNGLLSQRQKEAETISGEPGPQKREKAGGRTRLMERKS